jgi:hypothetical protein
MGWDGWEARPPGHSPIDHFFNGCDFTGLPRGLRCDFGYFDLVDGLVFDGLFLREHCCGSAFFDYVGKHDFSGGPVFGRLFDHFFNGCDFIGLPRGPCCVFGYFDFSDGLGFEGLYLRGQCCGSAFSDCVGKSGFAGGLAFVRLLREPCCDFGLFYLDDRSTFVCPLWGH